jgi:hypothetical protein
VLEATVRVTPVFHDDVDSKVCLHPCVTSRVLCMGADVCVVECRRRSSLSDATRWSSPIPSGSKRPSTSSSPTVRHHAKLS